MCTGRCGCPRWVELLGAGLAAVAVNPVVLIRELTQMGFLTIRDQRINWRGRKNSDSGALRERAASAVATSRLGPQRQGLWFAASPKSIGLKGAWWPKTCAIRVMRWLEFLSSVPVFLAQFLADYLLQLR